MAQRVRKVNASTDIVHVLNVNDLAPSAYCYGIEASNNGTVYLVDYDNRVLYKIFEDGRIEGVLIGHVGAAGDIVADGIVLNGNDARLYAASGLCVDASDNIYITDQQSRKLKRVSPSGRIQTLAGSTAAGDVCSDNGLDARFNAMIGIAVDKAGVIYGADSNNHKIKKIWPSGKVTSLAGGTGGGFANGVGSDALFDTPHDVAVDMHGNVYVADSANHRIRKVTESGVVTTLAGNGVAGHVDGNGLVAQFTTPRRLAIDPSNQYLYVMDGQTGIVGNNVFPIRKVSMSGQTTTFMGYNSWSYNGDLAFDKSGFLYILEQNI